MAAPLLRSCRLGASLFTAKCQTTNQVSQYSTSESLVTSTGKKDELYRQLTLEIKGHDSVILNSYQKFTAMAAKELGVNIVSMYDPPRIFTRMSLMKSVFVHKKHFHQYEMRTMYKVFQIKHITGSTASTFLEYIQRNLPEGMAMKVTKIQIEQLPSHIKPPADAANQIQSSQQTTKH